MASLTSSCAATRRRCRAFALHLHCRHKISFSSGSRFVCRSASSISYLLYDKIIAEKNSRVIPSAVYIPLVIPLAEQNQSPRITTGFLCFTVCRRHTVQTLPCATHGKALTVNSARQSWICRASFFGHTTKPLPCAATVHGKKKMDLMASRR